jgi:hypothetical protein
MYNVVSLSRPVQEKIPTTWYHMYQFRKSIAERKICVLDRPAKLSINVLTLKIVQGHCIMNVHKFTSKVPVFFQILMIAEFSRQIFEMFQIPFQ